MKIDIAGNSKKIVIRLITLILIMLMLCVCIYCLDISASAAVNSKEEAIITIEQMIQNRNNAVISQDMELIKSIYDTNTRYGLWAYQYEQKKMKYLHNWEQKQGVKFIEINPKVVVKSIRGQKNKYTASLLCSTEYKYIYEGSPDNITSFRIGTYHVIDLVNKGDTWVIGKEWYKDPFGDSLNLDALKVDSIKEHISSQVYRDLSGINQRRIKAVEYADKYCGAATEEKYGFKYNNKYRNYNGQGGDCANFASQVLFEGAKFKKTHAWNYDGRGATHSWLNAGGFTSYMVNSGRASLIAKGSYEKVYKNSYKLLPGDFVAYEKGGDITHVSVVTGADSKGYSMVSCHNSDRNKVPWDLGWNNKGIKFWLVRVHY